MYPKSMSDLLCEGIKVRIRNKVLYTQHSILELLDHFPESFLKVVQPRKEEQGLRLQKQLRGIEWVEFTLFILLHTRTITEQC